jgi:hypothetical protein
MTIRVHQELKDPSNMMDVWMIPRIKTPTSVPIGEPIPPVKGRSSDHHCGNRIKFKRSPGCGIAGKGIERRSLPDLRRIR